MYRSFFYNCMWNYVAQFMVGGALIVGMTWLSEHVSAKYAAVLYSLPWQFTVAAVFIYLGTQPGTLEAVTRESFFYITGVIGFIGVFYLALQHLGFWTSLTLTYALYLGAVGLSLYLF